MVAQSHTVIDHLLERVVAAGVDAAQIARRGSGNGWRRLDGSGSLDLEAAGGSVIGGTVWDLANRNRVPAGHLDLLVVEEAGQLSLADTLAAATAARRLLLVGDPQQLPQVSQARHPPASTAPRWDG